MKQAQHQAKHFGFSDGMRRAIGREIVHNEIPVCVEYLDDYNIGVYEGFQSATKLKYPAPPEPYTPFFMKPFVAMWDWLLK